MHRNGLIQELKSYREQWPEENAEVDRFVAFVKAHADCYRRELTLGHLTGAAWIEDAGGRQVLLMHHRKLNRWLQPGGHADGDTNLERVARREAEEETGLADLTGLPVFFDIDIHPIPARGQEPSHHHYDVRYRFRAGPNATPVANHESLALRWFEIEEVATWTDQPSMSRMAIKALANPFP